MSRSVPPRARNYEDPPLVEPSAEQDQQYVPPHPLPSVSDHDTIDNKPVKLAPEIDPHLAPTDRVRARRRRARWLLPLLYGLALVALGSGTAFLLVGHSANVTGEPDDPEEVAEPSLEVEIPATRVTPVTPPVQLMEPASERSTREGDTTTAVREARSSAVPDRKPVSTQPAPAQPKRRSDVPVSKPTPSSKGTEKHELWLE